ncbi:TetR family transcriptional regulator [Pontibacillus halophilus JSM 076056 = DSM 19796]|uniref:TetR family transcriptional regulator n=1 Tax=Pontibacillus halophilus JSM 076056 = DSM 19796 TaxID=1385510 RepID=A0A0A5GQ06_9BACI|nr:TetR/AcrR family transcriptional regulator [Pontibacillus halophilus]KGX94024.1 TetR family transcriptional regulator [Pontibacillus halophilus JSM 076056 = DSM 19796]
MPRRKVQEELSKERILETARELFVTEGYEQLSMRKLAKKLGYSHGSIYYHFQNKAELFFALVKEDFASLTKEVEPFVSRGSLQDVFIAYMRFGLTYRSHYEVMFLLQNDDVQNYMVDETNESYRVLAKAVQFHTTKTLSIQEIWSLYLSLHGFVTHYLKRGQSYEELEEIVKAHATFLSEAVS